MRDNSVDIAKGLGILFVIGGHCAFEIPDFPSYSFHIPLFYFISGFFIHSYISRKPTCTQFVKKRFDSLLVPYFIYNIIFGFVTYLLGFIGILNIAGGFFDLLSFRNLVLEPFISGHQYQISLALWFVPSLFLVMLLVAITRPALSLIVRNRAYMLFYVIFLVLAYYLSASVSSHENRYLGMLGRTVIGYVYCVLGMLYYLNRDRIPKLALFLLALFIYAAIAHHYGQYTYISAHNDYGSGLKYRLSLPVTLSGTLVVVAVANMLDKYGRIARAADFAWLGRNSYHIMAVHLSFLLLLNLAITIFIPGRSLADIDNIFFRYNRIIFVYFFFATLGSWWYVKFINQRLHEKLLRCIFSRWSKDPA